MSDFTRARDQVAGEASGIVRVTNWRQRGLLALSHLVAAGIGAFVVWVF